MNASLIDAMEDGSLIALIGAGTSRPFTDPDSNIPFPGLPAATDLVSELNRKRPTIIDVTHTFGQACFLFREKDGRSALERFLQSELDKPTLKPLPAHMLCAALPFAAYITTNYDMLLEKSLTDSRRTFRLIINDDDVARMRPDNSVPLLKLHGCVSRPQSLLAAEDELRPLHERAPIIEAFLKSLLASKSILFLGFSLTDVNFVLLHEEVHRMLGKWTPRSYAVVRNPTPFEADYWKNKGVHIIDEDLTGFLKQLIKEYTDRGSVRRRVAHPTDEWLANPFFASLLSFRTLPSETQVLDAFLTHLLHELRNPLLSLADIVAKSRAAKDLVVQYRTNYVALERLGAKVLGDLAAIQGNDKVAAEQQVNAVIQQRTAIGRGISSHSARVIKKGNSILVYSQSVRVLELLTGVPRGVQDQCHIYIAECRPKSPDDFQDALAIAEHLKGTGYKLTLIPDAAMGNLIERNNISVVLMGAHAIYVDNHIPKFFVNTCGSSLLLHAARAKGVPVFVIAESSKQVVLPGSAATPPTVSYQEEEALFGELVSGQLQALKATGLNISANNIGYDLCTVDSTVQFVSEL